MVPPSSCKNTKPAYSQTTHSPASYPSLHPCRPRHGTCDPATRIHAGPTCYPVVLIEEEACGRIGVPYELRAAVPLPPIRTTAPVCRPVRPPPLLAGAVVQAETAQDSVLLEAPLVRIVTVALYVPRPVGEIVLRARHPARRGLLPATEAEPAHGRGLLLAAFAVARLLGEDGQEVPEHAPGRPVHRGVPTSRVAACGAPVVAVVADGEPAARLGGRQPSQAAP